MILALLAFSATFSPALAGGSAAPAASAAAPAATAVVGKPAPDFTLTGVDGKAVRLADLKGKTVVIEWFNPDCPFVKYAHGPGGPLADMAARVAKDGVVWLAVNSGAAGKQGHGAEVNKTAAGAWGMSHAVLLDENGAVGRTYGATTTPNMYVVAPDGTLAYAGALDNAPLGKAEGTPVNYVSAALTDIASKRTVATPTTKPYGCSVKYGS